MDMIGLVHTMIIGGIKHIVSEYHETGTFFYCGGSTGETELVDQPDHATVCKECFSEFCENSLRRKLTHPPGLLASPLSVMIKK